MSRTNLRLCRKYNISWSLVRLPENPFISFDENKGRFSGKGVALVEQISLVDKHE